MTESEVHKIMKYKHVILMISLATTPIGQVVAQDDTNTTFDGVWRLRKVFSSGPGWIRTLILRSTQKFSAGALTSSSEP